MVQVANPAEMASAGTDYVYRPEALLRRIERVREAMENAGVDSMLLSNPHNRHWLTGFTGEDAPPLDTAGFLLIGSDDLCLITDGRYTIQAGRELAPELGVQVVARTGKLEAALNEQISARKVKRLGFETAHLLHMYFQSLTDGLPEVTLVPTTKLVEPFRMVKDEEELSILRRAISISDRAFNIVSRRIEPGMTEKQVAWEIEKTMRDLGADDRAFGTTVAGGPNGAMAHAGAGDRPLREGEPIVIDMGAKLHGYSSDMTRTICLGEPTDKFREIYNIVLRAHLACEEQSRAGISGHQADAYCREVIAEAGYGDYFTHSTGHGIGLEVHEGPSLRKAIEDPIPAGSVASVEPGIYIEGWGGVRIEDLVLFRENDVEVLTQADKQGLY
ncbi:MAG: aminopeptidase P family protein [Chloroflexota bacterium]|nr:aminopeptidase P family protein [Chloroflexota bacterium]